MIRRLRNVFYIEIIINLVSVGLYLFAGETGVRALGVDNPSPLLISAFQWFAVLTFVITWILGRALTSGDERALRFVLEGYLIGDVIYLVVLFGFVDALGGVWAGGSLFALIITLLLIAARVVYLWGTRQSRAG